MKLTRKLRRKRVGGGLTFEAYCKKMIESLPTIDINGKPMNHRVGIEAAITQATNESQAVLFVLNYVEKTIQLYKKLIKDKEEFDANKLKEVLE